VTEMRHKSRETTKRKAEYSVVFSNKAL